MDALGRPMDALGRPLESDSSSSSSDSDSDSDFDEEGKGLASAASSGSMPSFMNQDFTSGNPFPPQRSGGVLPTARLQSHKSRKSQSSDGGRSKSKSSSGNPPPSAKTESTQSHANPANNSMTNLLGDDLRLSDSDNSE